MKLRSSEAGQGAEQSRAEQGIVVNIRRESSPDGVEKQGDEVAKPGNGSAQTAAAGEEGREEVEGAKEEGNQDEHPAEAPQVKELLGGGVPAQGADEGLGRAGRVGRPGLAKGRCRACVAAVAVAPAAEVEVGPLGGVAGARDGRGVGAEEVGLVEGGDVCDAREDDEPQEEEGGGQ